MALSNRTRRAGRTTAKGDNYVPGFTLERRHEENVGITCIDAAEQLVRRGHELEDHTYSHIELRTAERKGGTAGKTGSVHSRLP
jgi:hypothetical protein